MKCAKCENIQKDPKTGMLFCITCGNVVDDIAIVQNVEFDSNQEITGTFVNQNKGNFINFGKNSLSQMIDATQLRLNKVYKLMFQIATTLTIPNDVVERAKKLYNIASNKKFTQGRKTNQIVGAVMYLACRWDCTKHLLIDFSEVLQTNLFVIGSAYLRLVKLLGMQIKLNDPSLYMRRFCQKINFGNKNREVENTALKLLQFLKRDWISTGRRPAGLCGACLYISGKLHGFDIDIDYVANCVNVCNGTIKKRIEEFSLTEASKMTKEEFEAFENTHYYNCRNPPAFIKNRLNEKEKEKEIDKGKCGMENNRKKSISVGNNNVNGSMITGLNTTMITSTVDKNDDDDDEDRDDNLKGNNEINTGNNYNYNEDMDEDDDEDKHDVFLRPIQTRKISFGEKSVKSKTELLSNFDGDEENKYLYKENEYVIRKYIWDVMYRDWIEEQKEKKLLEEQQSVNNTNNNNKNNSVKKRNASSTIINIDKSSTSPYEAIKSSNKFGRKINYNYVKNLFQKSPGKV